ncbi:hypothetical protein QFC21_000238 [Naganishia friedmannii]|uniref:Uncharacterized protein n=1 Tax=Naganishia friedmannii TaxID=89922 RepID=A0ACC2WEG3_9TREE|nr:hypothetical protein QFC21_000238 [Naganishia friedmannii]
MEEPLSQVMTTMDRPLHNNGLPGFLPPPHRHYTTADEPEENVIRQGGKDAPASIPEMQLKDKEIMTTTTTNQRETALENPVSSLSSYLDQDRDDVGRMRPPPPPLTTTIRSRSRNRQQQQQQQKRSMTLPDEYMNGFAAGGAPLDTLDAGGVLNPGIGLGFDSGIRRGESSVRLVNGYTNTNTNVISSPSSDDEDSFTTGPNLSFRKERLHVTSPLAMAGPSRYPGMLQLPLGNDSAVSPRMAQKRQRTGSSRGGSPDIEQQQQQQQQQQQRNGNGYGHAILPVQKSTVPSPTPRGGFTASPLGIMNPPVTATPRLQAIGQQRDRPRSSSIHSLAGNKQDRSVARLRRISTDDYVPGSGDSTTTPTSTRPPSRHRKDSTMSTAAAGHSTVNASSNTNNSKQRQHQGASDADDANGGGHSSSRGPSGDESMNEEKQDFAKTVGRKRKQSEDFAVVAAAAAQADKVRHQHQQQQRSLSMPVVAMSAVPESAEYGGLNEDDRPLEREDRERPRRRHNTRGMEDLGLEGALEVSQRKPRDDAASSAVLENLLQSIDLANAMRLIQKQTAIPSGVHDDDNGAINSATVRVSPNASKFRNNTGNGKMAEMFVPVAPPPILYGPNQQDGSSAAQHRADRRAAVAGGGGHVAFTHPGVEVSSSEDAHSVRSVHHPPTPLPALTQGRASRLSTSSSIPSGLFGSRRHVSTPTSLVSGSNKGIESGTTKTQLFLAGGGPGAVPEPNNKHKRSISERFSLNRHLLGHGKKNKAVLPVERSLAAGQVEVDDEVAMEAKDMAKFQGKLEAGFVGVSSGTDAGSLSRSDAERIQLSMLELSHHPRAEKLAYQARSYLQGYYSNVFASIRDRQLDPDPIYVFDPLAVIRWRKAVREEEAKRVAYEASRTSAKAFSPGSGTALFDPRLRTPSKSTNSPDMSFNGIGQPASRPLHSAELLNRVDQSDTAKHLKISPALREWVVTPSEIVAYLNCKGVVDRFVPSNEFEHPIWGEMPQIDRSPSTMTASSTHSRSVTSPTSRMWQIKATSNMQNRPPSSAQGSEGGGDDRGPLHGRKDSLETSDRFASVIRSPLQRIRRHIHLDRESYPQSAAASDTENEGIKGSRRHALLYTAQRFKIGQSTKEQVQHVETAPTMSHESLPRPQSSTTRLSPQRKDHLHVDTTCASGRQSPLAPTANTAAQTDEFDILPAEVDEEEYRKKLRTLQSVENAMSRTPVAEREGQSLVKDFITTVENFRTRRGCSILEDDLRKMTRVQLGYVGLSRMPQMNGHASSNGALTGKPTMVEQNTSGRESSGTSDLSAFDSLHAAKDVIADLHERYTVAIRQAVEVCQQQDAVQRKVSELSPEAETLLSKIGDQVRKLRAIRESFYTLDAIRSNSNPAYYRVVNAGFWVD